MDTTKCEHQQTNRTKLSVSSLLWKNYDSSLFTVQFDWLLVCYDVPTCRASWTGTWYTSPMV